MKISDWSDLGLFAAVARHASLSKAADETGASQATLSRRMTALEGRLGRRLFCHGAAGYTPTADGRALLDRTKAMEGAARDVGLWLDGQDRPPQVRISAGSWSAEYLARNLHHYWSPAAPWRPEFVSTNLLLDIERREIDIGLRNRRPDHPWLAGRKTSTVTHAAYAADDKVTGWIGPNEDTAHLPSEAWTVAEHGDEIVVAANDPQVRLALALGGAGIVVLPCFAGDNQPGLVRRSAVIDSLTSEEWLVCHQDTRRDPAIRAALEAIAAFLKAPRSL